MNDEPKRQTSQCRRQSESGPWREESKTRTRHLIQSYEASHTSERNWPLSPPLLFTAHRQFHRSTDVLTETLLLIRSSK